MVDIHIHILPDVDDGSQDMEDSILMASLALEGGVNTIIATPHGNMSEGIRRKAEEHEHTSLVREVYGDFCRELKKRGIPLQVYLGMEIFSTPDSAEMLRQGFLLPMPGTNRCLIEFDFGDSADMCTRRIEEMLEAGYTPIIAHPERYTCVQKDLSLAAEWVYMGCQLQANRGSILGSFGKKPHRVAWALLQNDLLTYVGSDAHSPYSRTPYMQDVYDVISDDFSPRTAARLLYENAQDYLLKN